MYPVGFQEIYKEYDAAERPCDGVCKGNGLQLREVSQCDRHITYADKAPAQEHGVHGNGSPSRAAHDASDAVGKGQKEIEEADGPHMPYAMVDNIQIGIEEPYQFRGEQITQDTDTFCREGGAYDAEANTFFDACIVLGAKILTDKCGKGHGEAGDREEREAFYLGVGATAGHGGGTEAVDIGLDDQICQGDHRVLDA